MEEGLIAWDKLVYYPDPAGKDPRLVVVDLRAGAPLPRPVTLDSMKAEAAIAGSPLLRQGRLSVVPITEAQWRAVERLAGKRPTA